MDVSGVMKKKWEKVEAVCSSVDLQVAHLGISLYLEIFKR